MILVDIGNSGLRAIATETSLPCSSDVRPLPAPVVQLSWSAIGQQIRKAQPQREPSTHERWSQIGDLDGLVWLVDQFRNGQLCNRPTSQSWRIASVNRAVHDRLVACIREHAPYDAIHTLTYRDLPIAAQVDAPERVGIDRLLAARGALHCMRERSQSPGPMIVVQAGTALTIDWVDDQGGFCGGAILPGVGLALQYLAAGTDQLPWLPMQSISPIVPDLPGRNTDQAIAAGVHAAVVGGAKYLIDRYRQNNPIPVVVSGGDGRLLRQEVEPPVHFVDHLVLIGLSLPLLPVT